MEKGDWRHLMGVGILSPPTSIIPAKKQRGNILNLKKKKTLILPHEYHKDYQFHLTSMSPTANTSLPCRQMTTSR